MKRRVSNASPIVFLAKLNRFELLRLGVDEVLVPTEVIKEIRAKQDEVTTCVERHLGTWLRECVLAQPETMQVLVDLDAGERAVIAQALQERVNTIATDDMAARRLARRLGLKPIGTVGLLLAAKKRGMLQSLRNEIARLRDLGFWITDDLVRHALREAGEDDAQ